MSNNLNYNITYTYSFLLESFAIAPPCDPCRHNEMCTRLDCEGLRGGRLFCKEDTEEWLGNIKQIFNEIHKGVTLKNDVLLHLSEELVANEARLPLYHLFPHLSFQYSLGRWKVQKFARPADNENPILKDIPGFSEIPIEISVFVFESGAGLLSLQIAPESEALKTGQNLEHLCSAINFSQFSAPNCLTNQHKKELPYVFSPPEKMQEWYREENESPEITLQEIFQTELNALRRVIAGMQKKIKSNISTEEWPSIDEVALYPISEGSDDYPLCYYQQPFISAFIATQNKNEDQQILNDISESNNSSLYQFYNIESLEKYGIASEYKCIFGGAGLIVAGIGATSKSINDIREILFRIFGSIRLSWHSMTVMNCYMGRKLVSLSESVIQLENQEEEDHLVKSMSIELRKLRDLTKSFYAFIMTDDPLLNAVHFASYRILFRKASLQYDFLGVKDELWQKLSALHGFEARIERALEINSGQKQFVKVGRFWSNIYTLSTILALLYVGIPKFYDLFNKNKPWQIDKRLGMVATILIGMWLMMLFLKYLYSKSQCRR